MHVCVTCAVEWRGRIASYDSNLKRVQFVGKVMITTVAKLKLIQTRKFARFHDTEFYRQYTKSCKKIGFS